MKPLGFAPRRLGHANLFVADLERSIDFYGRVAGIELVRREPGINAGFHSNGNTHHDVGLIQTAKGAVYGKGGYQQPASYRGTKPGLNHLGWEMASERDLVDAVRRGEAAGLKVANYANHQISHSAYVFDPDGNYHEFYADMLDNWRSIFNLEREELVTEAWDWKQSNPGRGPTVADPNDRRRVDSAVFHPQRITHVTMAAANFDAVANFYTATGGLSARDQGDGVATFGSANSDCDVVLFDARYGHSKGIVGQSFLVEDEADLARSIAAAPERGIELVGTLDNKSKLAAFLRDPDGVIVEFYSPRNGARVTLPSPAGHATDKLWMFAA